MKFNSRYLWGLIPVFLVLGILYYFSDIVTYVILAWALSMLGAPLVKFFRRFMGKNMAAGITLGLFVILSVLIIWLVFPPIVQQARNLSSIDYNKAISSLDEPIKDWQEMLEKRGILASSEETDIEPTVEKEENSVKTSTQIIKLDSLNNINPEDSTDIAVIVNIYNPENNVEEDLQEAPPTSFSENLRKNLFNYINPNRIQTVISSIIGFLGNFVIAFFSILFIGFFFLREQGLFFSMVSSVIPDQYVSQSEKAIEDSTRLLVRYFIGIFIQVTIITTFVSILLTVVGIKNALLIGFFASLMNVIPYLGPMLGASFGIIITITSNIDVSFYDHLLPQLVKVIIVFVIMQLVDNFIIQPFIFGKSVKAHPLEIFIVILIGGQLGGILGMVLAIPVYTVIRVLAKVFLSEFKVVQRITQSI